MSFARVPDETKRRWKQAAQLRRAALALESAVSVRTRSEGWWVRDPIVPDEDYRAALRIHDSLLERAKKLEKGC